MNFYVVHLHSLPRTPAISFTQSSAPDMDEAQFFPSPTGSRGVRVWTNLSDPEKPSGYGEVPGTHSMSPLSTPRYIDRLYDLAAQANRPVILYVEVNFLSLVVASGGV